MNNFIIVEGCDCSGKSSLIYNLSKFIDFEYKHFSSPPSTLSKIDQHNYCKNQYYNELKKDYNKLVVFDRFYFGEQIYAPIYRNYYPDYINDFENKLNNHNVLLVLVEAKPEIIMKRFDNIFIQKNDIPKIVNTYKYIFEKSIIKNKMIIDTSYKNSYDCAKEVYNEYQRSL